MPAEIWASFAIGNFNTFNFYFNCNFNNINTSVCLSRRSGSIIYDSLLILSFAFVLTVSMDSARALLIVYVTSYLFISRKFTIYSTIEQ
jgi:hypothetical protein